MKKRYVIGTTAQLSALRSPLRHEILASMEQLGSCSVGELASHLGRPPQSLYYHVLRLAGAGLIRVKRLRPSARRPEAIYEPVAREILVDPSLRSSGFLRALREVYRAALRAADRDLSRALSHEVKSGSGGPRGAGLVRWTARLDRASEARLRALLMELGRFMADHDTEGERSYSVTAVFSRRSAHSARGRRAGATSAR